MRLKILGALALVVVGVAAVGLTMFSPVFGSTQSQQYLTAQVTRTNVVQQVVATGSVSAQTTYGLNFGRVPTVTNGSTTSASSSSSGSGGTSGASTWIVATLNAKVGQRVSQGAVLATADPGDAQLAVTTAQANLAAAQARLAADQSGATGSTLVQAQDSLNQSAFQLNSARQSEQQTIAQNNLQLQQAQAAVVDAQQKLASDQAASAPSTVIDVDQGALTQAQDALSSTQLKVTASNQQAATSLAGAQLSYTSAEHAYQAKVAPAAAAQIASDQSQVAAAQAQLASAQQTLSLSSIVAPAAGVITSVSLDVGAAAPSGDAIQLQAGPMVVNASVAETDLTSVAVGQAATVTIPATEQTLTGTVTEISPTASSSGTSSVVTYPIVISLGNTTSGLDAGMTADVTVATAAASNVLAVPSAAIQGSTGNYSVRVMQNGRVVSKPVQVGLVTTSLAEIQSGLSVGDTVVIGTVSSLQGSTATTNAGGFGGGLGGLGGGNFVRRGTTGGTGQ